MYLMLDQVRTGQHRMKARNERLIGENKQKPWCGGVTEKIDPTFLHRDLSEREGQVRSRLLDHDAVFQRLKHVDLPDSFLLML